LTMVMAALIAVVLVQIYFLARMRRSAFELGRMHERVTRLDAAVNVLTDTCDCGFRTIAEEIGRALDHVNRPVKRSASRRVRAAAMGGAPVAAIAAAEQMSEGEVRLRLQLPSASAPRPAVPKNDVPKAALKNGAMRHAMKAGAKEGRGRASLRTS
jgi:hypothetical protein